MKNKTLIIAEAGVNHNGSLPNAKRLIDVAVKAKVDIVKFQTFKAEKIVSKAAKKAAYQVANMKTQKEDSQFEMLKKLELDWDTHKYLLDYCKERNIQFLSTAFDLESIDLLDSLDLPLFKIPSGEITNLPYLEKIASKNKPTICSTGMSTMTEIESMLSVLISNGLTKEKITLLHCNTEYPTPMEDVNLRAMLSIKEKFGTKIGYSDHTLGIEIPIAAVAMGAVCIEKHFTLDKNMEGPDHKASLEPSELIEMVKGIRNIEKAMGNGIKKPSKSEQKNIPIARKSIHLQHPVLKGKVLKKEDLVMKRPGNGISPMLLHSIIGQKVNKDLPVEHLLSFNDLV